MVRLQGETSSIPPEVSKAWADRLESGRQHGSKWQMATFRQSDSVIYLVADGAYTTSLNPLHFAKRVSARFQEEQVPGSVCAFSYAGYGRQYLPEHTDQPMGILRMKWRSFMNELNVGQRLIPICYSLSAAVALLGLQDWRSTEQGNPRDTIPGVILVAPAHAPSTHLAEGYQRKLENGELEGGIPTLIRELCDASSPVRQETADSLANLPLKGMRFDIIHWPADIFTPYDELTTPEVHNWRIMETRQLTNVRLAAREHQHIPEQDETMAAIIKVVRQY